MDRRRGGNRGPTPADDSGSSLQYVQIDGLAVLKIVKHCRECLPELVTGQLLGLDIDGRLEVTDCFPFPSRGDDNDDEDGASYQIEMMKNLRDVNVDNNMVGWYQSTYLGSFLSDAVFVETQLSYQENLSEFVVIVYDPYESAQGVLSLRAFRMTKAFSQLLKQQDGFSPENIKKYQLTNDKLFEEVKVVIHNSALAQALLYELDDPIYMNDMYDRLDLTINPYIEKKLDFVMECADDLSQEQSKYNYYLRNAARLESQKQAFLAKRHQENELLRMEGKEPLPDDDVNEMFKTTPAPSRYETLLLTKQINDHCQNVNEYIQQATSKLYLGKALQNPKA